MNPRLFRGVVLATVMLLAVNASAQLDALVVSEMYCSHLCPTPPPHELTTYGFGQPHSTRLTDLHVIESAPDGRMFGLLAAQPSRVVEVFANGTYVPRSAPLTGIESARDLTVARSGAVYVLGTNGFNGRIVVLDPAGTQVRAYEAGGDINTSSRIELAADQCTIAYTNWFAGTIRRLDVCTGTPLPELGPIPLTGIDDLRILPDGGYLLASSRSGAVRLNAAGAQTRVYSLGGADGSAIGLTRGGTTALIAGEREHRIVRLDLDSGEFEVVGTYSGDDTQSITPRLAWTAALGAASHHDGADVPALSTWAILLIIGALGFLGVRHV